MSSQRRRVSSRPSVRPLSAWFWMLLAGLAAGSVIWATTAWLYGIADQASTSADRVAERIEAIRTGLAAGDSLNSHVLDCSENADERTRLACSL
jgi:hypothetical protein